MAKVNEEKGVFTDAPEEKDILAEVDARIAQMLAAAEERANAIIAAAEEKAKAGGSKSAEDAAKANAEMEEYVEVKLFKDNGKYKAPVFVAVNGENCVIQRGVKVKIKRKFAMALDQSDMQDYMTAQLMDAKEAEYKADSLKFNM